MKPPSRERSGRRVAVRTGSRTRPVTPRTEATHKIKRFQPLRYAADEGLRTSITGIIAWLGGQEQRLHPLRKQRSADGRAGFAHAVETLICNLIALPVDGETTLAIPLGNDRMWGKPRYRPLAYGQHFKDAVDLMTDLKLVRVDQEGFLYPDTNYGQPTTIIPDRTALAVRVPLFAQGALNQNIFRLADPPETIVLKGVDKKEKDYVDTADTLRWRAEMQTINAMLRDAPVSLAADAVADKEGHMVDACDRMLRRIFNNGSWEQGGRLADGFWMNMARDDRYQLIRIAGQPTANVDFCQFNLRRAYAMVGAPMPDDGTDPYVAGEGDREGWKKVTNSLFNKKKPRNGWPADEHEKQLRIAGYFPPGTKAGEVISAIQTKHAPIADLFEAGHGLRFMRTESDILVAVLLKLIERSITALPLHDSVIVQTGEHAEIAKEIMEAESNAQIGTAIPAKIEAHATLAENAS